MTQHNDPIREVATYRYGVITCLLTGSADGTACVAELNPAGVHRTICQIPLIERSAQYGVSSVRWNPEGARTLMPPHADATL